MQMIFSGSGIGGRKVISNSGSRRRQARWARIAGRQRRAQIGRDVAAVHHVIVVHHAPACRPVRADKAHQAQSGFLGSAKKDADVSRA